MADLDGAIFYIINKVYSHARLAQLGTGRRDIGTYEQKVYPDQLWRLQAEPKLPGYYYICNVDHDGYGIEKWGGGDKEVGNYNGQYFEDQLWKFEKSGQFYRIFNYKYKDAKMAKFGKGDRDWGTYSGDNYDDQLWKLAPLLEGSLGKTFVWSIDNRQGSENVTIQRSVTKGVKITQASSLTKKTGFKASLQYSASLAIEGIFSVGSEMNYEFTQEIETSLSHADEKQWSETTTVIFTAPKGVNYRVTQWQLSFGTDPMLEDDQCQGQVLTKFKVEETTGDFSLF